MEKLNLSTYLSLTTILRGSCKVFIPPNLPGIYFEFAKLKYAKVTELFRYSQYTIMNNNMCFYCSSPLRFFLSVIGLNQRIYISKRKDSTPPRLLNICQPNLSPRLLCQTVSESGSWSILVRMSGRVFVV